MAWRQPQRWLLPMAFYALIASIFPLMMGFHTTHTQHYAPAVIWTMITLTCLNAHQHLFAQDHRHGILTQIALSRTSFMRYALVKISQFWLLDVLPLLLITPLIALTYQMPWDACGWLMLSLLLGTPSMVLLCAIPAALLQTLQTHTMLLCLLVLPLLIPELIFGAGVMQAWEQHHHVADPLYLLAAILLLCLSLAPAAIATGLKMTLTMRTSP